MLLKIKELRKLKKLTQSQLAEKIQVSVRTFGEYENETIDIPIKKLQKIADFLKVEIFELFEKKELKNYKIDIPGGDVIQEQAADLQNFVSVDDNVKRLMIEMLKQNIAFLEKSLKK